MTANQVTVARIVLLPLPCAMLLFAGEAWQWLAFVIFVLLGFTDFIDGMMARKEGPTKLGSLLDPVADKIMIAAITLALSGNGWVPAWVPVSILSREFLITALRSMMAKRQVIIKASNLAKMKTIIQMGGFGVIFLTLFLERFSAMWVSTFWVLFFLVIWGFYRFVRKESAPHWAFPVAGTFVYWFLLLYFFDEALVIWLVCLVIACITWISALDYLKESYRVLLSTRFSILEGSRLLWALVYGILVVSVVSVDVRLIIPALISISFELALGGIDNIAVSEDKLVKLKYFSISSFVACLFVVQQTLWAAVLMVCASVISCALASRVVKWRFFPEA